MNTNTDQLSNINDALMWSYNIQYPSIPAGYIRRIVDTATTANVTYIGYSMPGELLDTKKWAVSKIDDQSGILYFTVATNVAWNDREAESYV